MSTATLDGMFGTPAGIIAGMLAASATFKTITSSADTAAALGKIYYQSVDLDTVDRPFGLVMLEKSEGSGLGSTRNCRHVWMVAVEVPTPAAYASEMSEAQKYILSKAGAVLSEMAADQDQIKIGKWSLIGADRADYRERNESGCDYCWFCFMLENA